MANAKRLPSGKYRARVYDSESRKYKSFTADTKKEAELLAVEFANGKRRDDEFGKTVGELISDYTENKKNILSPTTIDSYRRIKNNSLSEICDIPAKIITQKDLQIHFNRLSASKSPKTVLNAHGLLMSVLNVYMPDNHFKVSLPKKQKKLKTFPKVSEVLQAVKGTDIELPCLLAIWQGLRMSEVRGAKKSDIKDGVLTIREVKVTVAGEEIVKKETKTYDSTRNLELPEYILDLISKQEGEYLTELSGQAIYKRFTRLLSKRSLPHITFHDLRHLNASVMLALGVPDKYAMERGGWSSTNIMKSVYQHTFSDERKEIDQRIDGYFNNILNDI